MVMSPAKSERRGFALVVVLGYVMAITMLSTVFLKTIHMSIDQQQRHVGMVQAYTLAESGVHHALAGIAADAGYRGEADISLREGTFSTRVDTGAASGTWIVESTGQADDFGNFVYTLWAEMRKTGSGWQVLAWERVPKGVLAERSDS